MHLMERSVLVVVLLITLFATDYSSALSCFSYDGFSYPDQQICPGTSQCCGITANCTENRLCSNVGGSAGTFVRGPCAVHPWDPAVCATICLYGLSCLPSLTRVNYKADVNGLSDESPQGGVFPRATVCTDGSYCCNNDSACCAKGNGVFLDRAGNIIATSAIAPTTTTQTTLSTGTASSSSVSTTSFSTISTIPAIASSSTIPAPTSTLSNPSTSLSHGAIVGLGVGVSFGAIITLVLAVIAWVLWKRRKPSDSKPDSPSAHNLFEQSPINSVAYSTQQPAVKNSDQHYYLHELAPSSPQEMDSTPVFPK